MSAKTAYQQVSTAQVVAAAGPSSSTAVTDVSNEVNVYINVTAAGTTMTPVIEVSPDGGTTWFQHTTGTAITATGTTLIKIASNTGRLMRINYTSVTGSFTVNAWIGAKRIAT